MLSGMGKVDRLLRSAREGGTLAFEDFVRVIEAHGFARKRTSGSHQIFGHRNLQILLNLQRSGRDAKRYQVKQFLAIVEEHALKPGMDP
jgi:predicted RNA binding protein YcfA (HicA-like mRNA interferase family)